MESFSPAYGHPDVVFRTRRFRVYDEPEKKSEPFHSFIEYRGPHRPPADLGKSGDVYLDSGSLSLYLKESEVWTRWDSSPLLTRMPHPNFPNRFLWVRQRNIDYLSLSDLRKVKIMDQFAVLKSIVTLGKRKADSISLNSKQGKKGRLSTDGFEPDVTVYPPTSISAPFISQTRASSSSRLDLAPLPLQDHYNIATSQSGLTKRLEVAEDFQQSRKIDRLTAISPSSDSRGNDRIEEGRPLQLQSPPPTPSDANPDSIRQTMGHLDSPPNESYARGTDSTSSGVSSATKVEEIYPNMSIDFQSSFAPHDVIDLTHSEGDSPSLPTAPGPSATQILHPRSQRVPMSPSHECLYLKVEDEIVSANSASLAMVMRNRPIPPMPQSIPRTVKTTTAEITPSHPSQTSSTKSVHSLSGAQVVGAAEHEGDDDIQECTQAEYRAAVRASKRGKRRNSATPSTPIVNSNTTQEPVNKSSFPENELAVHDDVKPMIYDDLDSLVYPDDEPIPETTMQNKVPVKEETDIEMAFQETQAEAVQGTSDKVTLPVDSVQQDTSELPTDLGFTEDVLPYLFFAKKQNKEKYRCKICEPTGSKFVYRTRHNMMLHLVGAHGGKISSFRKLQRMLKDPGTNSQALAKFLN